METPAESPTKRPKRQYTPEVIANALTVLKANNHNVFRTAKELNIPRLTLREWHKNNRRITPEVTAIQHQKELDMAAAYGEASRAYLNHAMQPDVIAFSTGLEAMKASAIATDKQQLLSGNPTSISSAIMTEDERRLRLAELLCRAEARRAAGEQPTPAQPQDAVLLQG